MKGEFCRVWTWETGWNYFLKEGFDDLPDLAFVETGVAVYDPVSSDDDILRTEAVDVVRTPDPSVLITKNNGRQLVRFDPVLQIL